MRKSNKLVRLAAVAAVAALAAYSASATLTIDSPGVVGAAKALTGEGGLGNPTIEQGIGQQILDIVGTDVTTTIGGRLFETGATDYSGTLGLGVLGGASGSVPAGWQYVIGKYDGPQGGYVLFYLGGAAFTLPQTSADIFVNGQGEGYGLSGFTTFNAVPEPSTLIAGALLLLPFGASTLRILRNRKS